MRPARYNQACRTARGLREAAGRAFTLVEVLVAVGAVAVIGVAIAAVFDQTGRTITAGRRLSTLTNYAGLIENQMRADFARMTRDGFLVIHNQMADPDQDPLGHFDPTDDLVQLHPDDLNARGRRVDEIMFFIEGDFTTAREPLVDPRTPERRPAVIARANAARIYYGHGKRRVEITQPANSLYMQPRLDDPNDEEEANLGVVPNAGNPPNPNRYASDWTLLRHQTILCSPRTTPIALGPNVLGITPAQTPDRDEQISLQPAASSIFRALATQFPQTGQAPPEQAPPSAPGNVLRPWGNGRALFSSGLVDIASTTLPEIRLVVLTADPIPTGAGLDFYDPAANGGNDGTNAGIDGLWRVQTPSTGSGGTEYDDTVTDRMQQWMADALPTWSHATDPDDRTRIRYEPLPPNFAGVLGNPNPNAAFPGLGLTPNGAREVARADQVMLGATSFIPHCTEFIVEWSFGKYFPSDPSDPEWVAGHEGEMIWHGMERLPDGTPVLNNDDAAAWPYDETHPQTGVVSRVERRFRRVDGSITFDGAPTVTAPNRWVQSWMIHDYNLNLNNIQAGDQLMSYFGYADPTFEPDKDQSVGSQGLLNKPADSASPTLPWPWPKLVRVTLGLADPGDPSVEQRFQFVFELPPNPEP